MNARKLEAFIVDRTRENILTKEFMGQLVPLTNEELETKQAPRRAKT